MPEIPNVYPWSEDGDELCPVLCDAQLWATIFSEANFLKRRFATNISEGKQNRIKKDVKRRLLKFVKHGSDNLFPETAVKLNSEAFGNNFISAIRLPHVRQKLASLFDRGELYDEFESKKERREHWIAEFTLDIALFSIEALAIDPEATLNLVAKPDSDDKYWLDIPSFSVFLQSRADDSTDQKRQLVLLGCAFAILEDEKAPDIYNALAEAGDEFGQFLDAEWQEPDRLDGSRDILPRDLVDAITEKDLSSISLPAIYPWDTNADGICPALDDPELWIFVLSREGIFHGMDSAWVTNTRKLIHKNLKNKFAQILEQEIAYSNSIEFGIAMTKWMREPHYRTIIFQTLKRLRSDITAKGRPGLQKLSESIGGGLYLYATRSIDADQANFLVGELDEIWADANEVNTRERWKNSIDVISRTDLQPSAAAVMLCAFALSKQGKIGLLATYLMINHSMPHTLQPLGLPAIDIDSLPTITEPEVSDDAEKRDETKESPTVNPPDEGGRSLADQINKSTQHQTPDAAESIPAEIKQLNKTLEKLQAIDSPQRAFSFNEYSQLCESLGEFKTALDGLIDDYRIPFEQLDALRQDIKQHEELVNKLEWISVSIDVPVESDDSKESFSDVVNSEKEKLQHLQRILRLGGELSILHEDLGEPKESIIDERKTLQEIEAELSGQKTHLEEKRRKLYAIQRDTEDFFQTLKDLDPDEATSLIQSHAKDDLLKNIFRYLQNESEKTPGAEQLTKKQSLDEACGLLLSYIWRNTDPSDAFLDDVRPPENLSSVAFLLGFFTPDELEAFCSQHLKFARPTLAMICMALFLCKQQEMLYLTERLFGNKSIKNQLTGNEHGFLEELIKAWHATTNLNSLLSTIRLELDRDDGNHQNEQNQWQDLLLEFISREPGLHGLYHSLRKIARDQYLRPLVTVISKGDLTELKSCWNNYGETETMVNECVKQLSGPKINRKVIQNRHRIKTQQYLDHFAEQIHKSESRTNNLELELAPLISACKSIDPPQEPLFHQAINHALQSGLPIISGFIVDKITDEQFTIGNNSNYASEFINHSHRLSWPSCITDQPVNSLDLLSDKLQNVAQVESKTPALTDSEMVEYYLTNERYHAAREVSVNDAQLSDKTESRIRVAMQRVLPDEFEKILVEAEEAKKAQKDGLIAIALAEVEQSYDALEFDELSNRFTELQGLLLEHEREYESTEKRQHLLHILSQTNIDVPDEAATSELESFVDKAKRDHQAMRVFLDGFQQCKADLTLSDHPSIQRLNSLAIRFDEPQYWKKQTADESANLADPIKDIVAQIIAMASQEIPESQQMAQGLAIFLETKIDSVFSDSDIEDAILDFVEICEKICLPYQARETIWELIGIGKDDDLLESTKESPAITEPVAKLDITAQKERLKPRHSRESHAKTVSIIREWIRNITSQKGLKEVEGNAEPHKLHTAIHGGKWAEVQKLTAPNINQTHEFEYLNNDEIAFSFSSALVEKGAEESIETNLENALLAVSMLPPEEQIIPKEFKVALAGMYLAAIAGKHIEFSPKDMEETHADVVDAINDNTPEAKRSQSKLRQLFAKASEITNDNVTGDEVICMLFWQCLTGAKSMEERRASLLEILYKIRQRKTLDRMAKATAKYIAPFIINCLSTFIKAANTQDDTSRSNLIDMANQRTEVFREQIKSGSKKNTKPWDRFFAIFFNQLGTEKINPPLTVKLISEEISPKPDKGGLIEIQLIPGVDAPESLELRLGDELQGESTSVQPILEKGKSLIAPEIYKVDIPSELMPTEKSGIAVIGHRFVGKTIASETIDNRDTWKLVYRTQKREPLTDAQLSWHWPGNNGKSVLRDHGFHGRMEEMDKIEQSIRNGQSMLLYGQRRIGKSSILKVMRDSYAPDGRRAMGLFIDCQGGAIFGKMDRDQKKQELWQIFVERILGEMENPQKNQAFIDDLTNKETFFRLARRDLKRKVTFANAMSAILDLITKHTKSEVKRVVFFVDEFQKYVAPILQDTDQRAKEEADALLWDIRGLQDSSDKIILILAGLPMIKAAIESYGASLNSSMTTDEIGPFQYPRDKKAIEDTFLPPAIRSQLCENNYEQIAKGAFDLCGGKPYFLSMFGKYAAERSEGVPFTIPLLHIWMEHLIENDHAQRQKYYQFAIEAIQEMVNEREFAIVKYILAYVAERGTAEFPWIDKREAREIAYLQDIGIPPKETIAAIKKLLHEGILKENQKRSQYRITLPFTHLALKADSYTLKQESEDQLNMILDMN